MRGKNKELILILIYILIFVIAFTDLRYYLGHSGLWRLLHHASVLGLTFLCVMGRISSGGLSRGFLSNYLVFFVFYELLVSALQSMFVIPMIFIDAVPWPIVFAFFYDYARINKLPDIMGRLTVLGMTGICLLSIPNILIQHRVKNGGALYATYYCFAFLPLLYMFCARRISALFTLLVILLMLLSLKRAAFIIVVGGVFLYSIVSVYVRSASRKRDRMFVLIFAGGICAAVLGVLLINRLHLNILKRLMGIFSDGGSGRTRIWRIILEHFHDSPLTQKVFGHGFHSVFYKVQTASIKRFAHNSLLETMYDYGVFGLMMMIFLMMLIIGATLMMIAMKYKYAPMMAFSLFPMGVLSVASYFFEQSYIILPICVMWGIAMGSFMGNDHADPGDAGRMQGSQQYTYTPLPAQKSEKKMEQSG